MEIKIYRFTKISKESNVKAYADLIIDNEVVIKGFKLVEGKEGLFLSNPSEKNKEGKYFDSVKFVTIEKKKEVEKMLIEKFNEVQNENKSV